MSNILRIEGEDPIRRCETIFTRVRRRHHHCRLCGLLFCGKCSKHRIILQPKFNQKKKVRVCDMCFQLSNLSYAPESPEDMYILRKAAIENGGIIKELTLSSGETKSNIPGERKSSTGDATSTNWTVVKTNALITLGLDPDADELDIRNRYKKLMRELHPDKLIQIGRKASKAAGGGELGKRAEEKAKEEANLRFNSVQKAYKLLQRDADEILADQAKAEEQKAFEEAKTAHHKHSRLTSRHLKMGTSEESCALCHRHFTLIFRRHHCRRCLVACCGLCSPTKKILASLNTKKPVRWCNRCVELVEEHGDDAPEELLMLGGKIKQDLLIVVSVVVVLPVFQFLF